MSHENNSGEQIADRHPFAETLLREELSFFTHTLGEINDTTTRLHGDAVRAFYIDDDVKNPLLHNLSVNTMSLMALDAEPGLDYSSDATYEARTIRGAMSGIALLQTMKTSFWEDSAEDTRKLLNPEMYDDSLKDDLRTAIKGSFQLIEEHFFGVSSPARVNRGYEAVVDQIDLEMAFQVPIINAVLIGDKEVLKDTARQFHALRKKLESTDPSLTHSASYLAQEISKGKNLDWAVEAFDDDAPAVVNRLSDIQALMHAAVFLQIIPDAAATQQTFADLLARTGEAIGYNQAAVISDTGIEAIYPVMQPMEVDWTVLPPGELQEAAIKICTKLQERGKTDIAIDVERLRALDILRSSWGKDRSYYVTGSLKDRRVIKKDGQEAPDEYIMLILQDLNEDGSVRGEHAVAESPITGKHASYVFRSDIDGLSWREVMAYDKRDARDFNARPVKHTKVNGILTPEMTAAKFNVLLNADADLFLNGEFRSGNLRIRKQVLDRLIDSALED
jgi:hypothetical protein